MFTILANGTRDGAYNLDYINDTVAEFGKKVQDGSKGTADAFAGLSKETQGVWEAFNNGKATAADVFKAVIGDLGSMDDKVKQNQIGVGLFATRWEDMGAKAVLGLTDVNGGLGDVNGRMDEMKNFKKNHLDKSFKVHCEKRKQRLEPLGKQLADLAADVLPKAAKGISDLAEWFSKLPGPVKDFVAISAGLTIVITAIGRDRCVIFCVWCTEFIIMACFGNYLGSFSCNCRCYLGRKNWGEITDWLSEKWSEFKDWFGKLWDSIVQTCEDGWSSTVDYFSGAWSDFLIW